MGMLLPSLSLRLGMGLLMGYQSIVSRLDEGGICSRVNVGHGGVEGALQKVKGRKECVTDCDEWGDI